MISQAPFVEACGAEYVALHDLNAMIASTYSAINLAANECRPVVLGVPLDLQQESFTGIIKNPLSKIPSPKILKLRPAVKNVVDKVINVLLPIARKVVSASTGGGGGGAPQMAGAGGGSLPGATEAYNIDNMPLGPQGVKWVKANSDVRLPFHSLRAHPGVFDSEGVVCAPNLIEDTIVDATFCTKPPTDAASCY